MFKSLAAAPDLYFALHTWDHNRLRDSMEENTTESNIRRNLRDRSRLMTRMISWQSTTCTICSKFNMQMRIAFFSSCSSSSLFSLTKHHAMRIVTKNSTELQLTLHEWDLIPLHGHACMQSMQHNCHWRTGPRNQWQKAVKMKVVTYTYSIVKLELTTSWVASYDCDCIEEVDRPSACVPAMNLTIWYLDHFKHVCDHFDRYTGPRLIPRLIKQMII